MLRVLGIDPGLALIGYGVVEEKRGSYLRLTSGCISTEKNMSAPGRLNIIYDNIIKIITEYAPDYLIMEKVFFNKNVTTAIKTGEARGVILLAASVNNLEVFEYTPLQIKQVVTGYGKASKQQVEKMVCLQLNIRKDFRNDDESDALAVSLCHLQQRKWFEAVEGRKNR